MVIPSDVTTLFPELAQTPEARMLAFIGMAERRVSRAAWGARADDGVIFMTAHLLTTLGKGPDAPAGPLTSVSVGEVSQGYAAPAMSDTALAATTYGREFLDLRRLVFGSRVA